MITDRNPLIVRHQRLVGAEQFANVGGVVNRRVKIGVVTNLCGYLIAHVGLRYETARPVFLSLLIGIRT